MKLTWIVLMLCCGFVCAQRTLPTLVIQQQAERTEAGFRYWSLDSAVKVHRFSNLAELLSAQSPAFFKQYGGSGLALPSLRGTGSSHTQTYWNGLSINSPVLGQFDYSLLPASLGHQVSLYLGAAGLELGSGALGGAVNVSTKAVFDTTKNDLLGIVLGNWGLWGLQAQRLRSTQRKFAKVFAYFRQAKNNFPFYSTDKVWQRANAPFTQINLAIDKARNTRRGTVHSSLWLSSNNRQIQQPITTNESQQEQLQDWALRKMVFYQNRHFFKITAGYFYQYLNYQNQTAQIQNQLHIHSFRLNFDNKKRFSAKTFLKTQLQGQYDRARLEQWRISAYWALVRQASKIETSLSLRPEYVQNGSWAFMPAAGVLLHLSDNFTLLANASQTFRQLTINELLWGENLRPEKAQTAELGANLHMGTTKFELSAFRADVQDWVLWRPSVPVWRPQNIDRVLSRGIESRIMLGEATQPLSAQVIYTYTRATSQGRQIIFTPEHQLKIRLQITKKGWLFAPDFLWVSKRYIQSDQNAYLPDYVLLGALIQKKIAKKMLLELKVNNFNNFNYQIIPFYAMPTRNFEFSFIFQNFQQ